MNLALIGYGRMGKLVEKLAPEYSFNVVLKLNKPGGITRETFRDVSVAIDFSVPGAVVSNAQSISELGIDLVIGTTGWLEHLPMVKAAVESHHTGLVWSPNYSVGVNLFTRLIAEAARLFQQQPEYETWAYEIHHSAKKDAPSGTLLKLIEEMQKAGYSHRIDVASNRAGAIPGTHEIGFDSAADTITLRHTARNREGFARGALRAAQWIVGKKGFHEFSEVLFS